jgi:hypothetical protein
MFTRLKVLWNACMATKCKHSHWRPAISNRAPAKWCDACGVATNITEAEFYALFGRSSYAISEIPRPPVTEHF